MYTIPPRPRWLAPLTLGYGVALFIWLTPEENSVGVVTIFGVGMALLGAMHLTVRFAGRAFQVWVWLLGVVVIGAVTGGGAAISTAALMFLKTAVHAHIYPDYPPRLMLAMIERAPAWTLAGALIGLALALMHYERARQR